MLYMTHNYAPERYLALHQQVSSAEQSGLGGALLYSATAQSVPLDCRRQEYKHSSCLSSSSPDDCQEAFSLCINSGTEKKESVPVHPP